MTVEVTLQTRVDEVQILITGGEHGRQVLQLSTQTTIPEAQEKGLWSVDRNTPVLVRDGDEIVVLTTVGMLNSALLPMTWSGSLGSNLRRSPPPQTVRASQPLIALALTIPTANWLLVVDQAGKPTGILETTQTQQLLSKLQIADWPADWQNQFQWRAALVLQGETSLQEVARQLKACAADDKMTIVSHDDKNNHWIVYTVKDIVDGISKAMPRPGLDYPLNKLFPRMPATIAQIKSLAEADWTTVQSLLPPASPAQLILAQEMPLAQGFALVLTRQAAKAMPSTGSAKGIMRGGSELTQFLAEYGASLEETAKGRVVNAWFDDGNRAVPKSNVLAANKRYRLGVNIGAPDDRSNVKGEQPKVSGTVIRRAIEQGEPLIARLDSQDFAVLDTGGKRRAAFCEKPLMLPPVGATEDVFFDLVAPLRTGRCDLHLGIYFQGNLVQSYRIYAYIAPAQETMPAGDDGWWSVCEYTLSADLADLDALERRRVCIWVGEGQSEAQQRAGPLAPLQLDPTSKETALQAQQAGISGLPGLDLGELPALNIRLIEEAFARYREILHQSCYSDQEPANDGYLYDKSAHTPSNPDTFTQNIKHLAELGQMLYQRLFGDETGGKLAQALRQLEKNEAGPLVLQIARLSLDMTFPWAVLYDRPLRYHIRRNIVCTNFTTDEHCQANCTQDDNTICPYGFWGFRYIIEQPLRPPYEHTSVITRLQSQARPRLAMVFGSGLGLTERHQQDVNTIINGRADCTFYGTPSGQAIAAGGTDDLLTALKQGVTMAYFYCHGGNQGFRQWLQVTDSDPLLPTYLGSELKAAWQASNMAPLMVLNGCHTARYTPGAFLSFVHRFGALGAAGVIGTEVPIHEYLGKYMGEFLIDRVMKGEPIGKIIYDLRRHLLQRQNFLGLAYVPYCYAGLRLDKEKAQ